MPLENLWRDLRIAVRLLRRSPSFTMAALATLAVAIAANAVVFAALNAVVLHPLQLPHENSLYSLEWRSDGYGADSLPNYRDLRDRNRSFQTLAAYSIDETALDSTRNPTRVWLYGVSGNYFQALGVHPYLGRLIQPSQLSRPALAGDFLGAPIRAFLTALMLLAALILLAACANLGSLFAARARDRAREIGMRLALGAGRARVLRQLFTEAILVSLAGGALGLALAIALLRQLTAWHPFPQFAINIAVAPDPSVYAFALGLALLSALLFGAVPIRQVLRADPWQVVKSASSSAGRSRGVLRSTLLTLQIAICALLITSSLVAVRGLLRTHSAHLGFQPQHALLFDTSLGMAGYKGSAVVPVQKRMIAAAQSIPGVEAAGMVGAAPPLEMSTWNLTYIFRSSETDLRSSNSIVDAITYSTTPGYLAAAGTRLVAGRAFTWADHPGAPRVAMVNRYFALEVFGSTAAALGSYFKIHGSPRIQIVGVVENGKYEPNFAIGQQAALFLPLRQSTVSDAWLVVRSSRPPQALSAALHAKMQAFAPGLPLFAETWATEMNGALFAPRMASASLGILGFMGALLSLVGIFGMATYAVSKRRRELGIRMALGARGSEVLRAALGHALRLLAFGSLAGLALGLLASQVLAAIVYEASARDPWVLGGVVLAMALVGLLATAIPARRALAIDPARLLRED